MYVSDFDALDDVLTYLDTISNNDRIAIENNLNFMSLRSVYDSLYLLVENDSTLSQMQSFTASQGDFFTLNTSELTENFPYSNYHSIADPHGVFVIDSTSYRISQQGIIAWQGGTASQISQLTINSNFNISSYPYLYYYIEPITNTVTGCGNLIENTFTNNSNDRRIRFSISTFKEQRTEPGYCNGQYVTYQHYVTDVVVSAFKKVWPWGGWRSYKTHIEFKEVFCEMYKPVQQSWNPTLCKSNMYYGLGGLFNQAASTEKKDRKQLLKKWIGSVDINEMGNDIGNIELNPPYFLKVKGKATSRGMEGEWGSLNCGY